MSSAVHACKLTLSTAAAEPIVTYHPRFRALLPQRLLMRDGVFNILFTYLLVPVAPLRVCTRARRKMPIDHLARASSRAGRRLLRGVPRETRHRRRRRRRRRRGSYRRRRKACTGATILRDTRDANSGDRGDQVLVPSNFCFAAGCHFSLDTVGRLKRFPRPTSWT